VNTYMHNDIHCINVYVTYYGYNNEYNNNDESPPLVRRGYPSLQPRHKLVTLVLYRCHKLAVQSRHSPPPPPSITTCTHARVLVLAKFAQPELPTLIESS
jgi:hypothetical protein